MQKFSLYSATGLFVLLIAGLYSCKKTDGSSNNQVIQTPYSLYYSDTTGALYNTNDGRTVNQVYEPDGVPCRAICHIGTSLLWAKRSIYVSLNNGNTFNRSYDSLSTMPDLSCTGDSLNLYQSMMINLPDWGRVYAPSSADPGSAAQFNYLGLAFNDSLGVRGKWTLDVAYDSFRVGTLPVRMFSLTRLKNGVLCGIAYDYPLPGTGYVRNFYRACKDCIWAETTANPDLDANLPTFNTSGAPLPPYSAFPEASYFILGHMNNRLIAVDAKCNNGAWYSDDTGANWRQYAGIPVGLSALCISAPFEQVCLVGTNGGGLYVLNLNTDRFEQNLSGLTSNLKIRSIAFKENIYKNKTSRKFIYLATDKGMFQSSDMGQNWVLTVPGNYVAAY